LFIKSLLLLALSAYLAIGGVTADDIDVSSEFRGSAPTGMDSLPRLLGVPVGGSDAEATPPLSMAPAEVALRSLAGQVARQSHPLALRYAFEAYFNYRSAHPELVRRPYLYFVDFGLDGGTPRGYVFDMDRMVVVEGPFPVAHGRGSGREGGGVPTRFSNTRGSNATSLGLFLAQETYVFSGRTGGRSYRSVGLRLRGVSGRFNSAARDRGIVVHGAPYVTASSAGRSEGCPAMAESLARKLIPRISDGGLVFHFSPHDPSWMRGEPWIGPNPVGVASAMN